MPVTPRSLSFLGLMQLAACSRSEHAAPAPPPVASTAEPRPADVDEARLKGAATDRDNWLSHGRTYDEQRFSPLAQIDATSVGRLGLAWSFDLDTYRGQEATPLVVDGVMYSTSAWSKVQALDAATGKLLWQYDPAVPPETGVKACCDVVNRGVALWKGRVYVGTLDGRLVALDAARASPSGRCHGGPDEEVHDHRRSARREGQGPHRQRWRRVRRPRLRLGLRRRDRQARVAVLHGPGRPVAALRVSRPREGGGDLARRVVEARWRRDSLGLDGVRSRAGPALHRRRQRLAVEPAPAQPGRRGQPVSLVHRRAEARYRRVRLALSDDSRRDLGTTPRPSTSCWRISTITVSRARC